METAVVCGYDAEDVLQEKTRTIDDHSGIWALVELWFSQEPPITSVTVTCYNSSDAEIHAFTITPVPVT
jgi:hypothetical protein